MAPPTSSPARVTEPGPQPNQDAKLLVVWERSAGLRAPPAPQQGALTPNPTGYLLAVGSAGRRMYPRLAAWARWSPALTIPTVAAMPFLLVPSPYGPLGVALLAAFAVWLPRAGLAASAAARIKRHLARTPRLSSWRQGRPGQPVRIEGIVALQPTVPSLFTNQPVVLARSDYAGATETRGIDFGVRLDDGELVHVPARDALLLGRSRRVRGLPACGPLALILDRGERRFASGLLSLQGWVSGLLRFSAHELTLSPGDRVELCGIVDREPDVEAEGGFSRDPSLRTVLRPSPGVPLLVRKQD